MIDESVIDIYKQLAEGEAHREVSKEAIPFRTMRDVFLLAACIGYEQGFTREPLPNGKKTTIRQEVFGETGLAIMQALAIAETNDVTILDNPADILTIAEEYAHAGIHHLKTTLIDEHGQPLWNLVHLLNHEG